MCSKRRQRGLTLVEVMVALVILAIISLLSWRALDSMTRSREVLDQRGAQLDQMQAYFRQWEEDCHALGTPDLWLISPPVHLGVNRVALIRGTQEGWTVVSWEIENNQLMRQQTPPLKTRARLREIWAAVQADQSLAQAEPQAIRSVGIVASNLVAQAFTDGRDWAFTDAEIMQGATQSEPRFLSGLRLSFQLPNQAYPLMRTCQTGLN
jgi:general secretion pathway protein J